MEYLHTRLRHLLMLLLEVLERADDAQALTVAELRDLLGVAGLGEGELEALWHHLHDESTGPREEVWLAARRLDPASHRAVRSMGPSEEQVITVPAFGYLVGLVSSRQISSEQMEMLIQYAQLVPDGPLGPGELEPLLERVIFAERAGRPSPGNGVH